MKAGIRVQHPATGKTLGYWRLLSGVSFVVVGLVGIRIRPSGNCVRWRERLQPHDHGSSSQLLPSLARYTGWG
jgi:hypothetical protein